MIIIEIGWVGLSVHTYKFTQPFSKHSLRELGDRSSASASLNHLGLVCTKSEKYDLAENYFSEALAIKRELGDQRGLVSVLINFAELNLAQQHWEDMMRLCNEAIEVIGDQPFHEPLAIASFLIGVWYIESGEAETAIKHFARAIAIAWNFNSTLGERINRSIVRNINTMNQLRKFKDISTLTKSILESATRMVGDEHSLAIDNLKGLLVNNFSK